jgi:PilZ domain
MFENTVSFLKRLVGGRPKPNAMSEGEERRVRVRHLSSVETVVHAPEGADSLRLSARVRNISRAGINLGLDRALQPGAIITIEMPVPEGHPPSTVLACVVHSTPASGGEWSVGCTFSRELSDADLVEFGLQRQKSPGPGDGRSWVRFVCNVQAVCDTVPANGRAPESVQVLNLSPSGVGLAVPRPIETGSMLSLELKSASGRHACTMLACVVHASGRDAGPWTVGCNFIRELTEQEMESLL